MRTNYFLPFLLLLAIRYLSNGQNSTVPVFDEGPQLEILCRDYGDSIAIRWAPTTWLLFEAIMQEGVTLTRTEYLPDGDSMLTKELLTFPKKQAWQEAMQKLEGSEAAYHILYEEIAPEMMPEGVLGNYRQAELQSMRLGFLLFTADLNFPLAEALALGYMDKRTSTFRSIKYTIAIDGTNQKASTSSGYGARVSPTPIDQVYTLPEDKVVTLRWDNFYNVSRYVAFHVEHSLDSLQWKRINEVPIAIVTQGDMPNREWVTYSDSVSQNFMDLYYRVQGINSFGELGPYSEVVKTQARPPLQINRPFIYRTPNRADTSIQVYWRLDGRDSQLIQTQIVHRAPHPDSNFLALDTLDGLARSYLDTTAGYENYYFIQAIDPLGRLYTGSLGHGQLPDKVPPSPPRGLSVVSDSLGNIQLSWASNTEEDLIGYRVYYQRHKEEDFIQLTIAVTEDTNYTHKLELDMLHDHAFYALRAEDHVGNRSALSPMVKVQLADTIAPTPASIVSVQSDFDGCTMQIVPSGSDDVVHNIIYRKSHEELSLWEAIDTLSSETQLYLDSLLAVGAEARYQVISTDESGNRTQSNIAIGRRIDNMIRPSAKDAFVTWSAEEDEITFRWSYPPRDDLLSFRFYEQGVDSERFQTLRLLRPSAVTIVAKQEASVDYRLTIPMGGAPMAGSSYLLKINFLDGAESKLATFEMK
ncbi:MAG: fibronectin type III domain-containing protein [Saprospiraceae bacterium]|nr:fibronectin type III domain-containing protein [Saprospiraceae bacterium]